MSPGDDVHLIWLLVLACSENEPQCVVPSAPGEDPALVFSPERPTNVLGISIDTLRWDRLGRNSGLDTTPFLDQVLAEGVVLEDLRACANWTLPSLTCAMTGQSTLNLGVEPMAADLSSVTDPLPEDLETLASWLSDAGHETRLVSAAKLFSEKRALANGFDQVHFNGELPAEALVDATLVQAAELALLEDTPFYLQVHFRDPHSPYEPPEAYQGELAGADLGELDPRTSDGMRAIRTGWDSLEAQERDDLATVLLALYDGEVRYLDGQLARLWTELEELGLLDDTLVVIWSDHGEQFFEHGRFEHGQSLHTSEATAVGGFWGHSLQPAAFEGPTEQMDIVPTVLDALGLSIPSTVTGLPVGTAATDRVRVSATVNHKDDPTFTVDREGQRLFYTWTGERALYSLRDDPSEQHDLYDSSSPTVTCLWSSLEPALALLDPSATRGEAAAPHP